ncbi:MAG TPA: prepilin-type N-terminal cleavage/methylation domain-containing protein [Thermoleophilaceae bacterium]|nr:prepilin-type N-terminal cleavage/methylation domain-containing protein [Thermoleophilaceae bacterium]
MGRAPRNAGRRSPRSQDGFTLIEVMVALLLLTVGIFAVATTFDFSRASTSQSELETAAVDRAQREIEAIRSLPYEQVAHPLGGIAPAAGDEADPAARVSGASFAWDRSNDAASEPLVISADGAVPMKQTIARGAGDRFGYTIWRFVTATDEPACVAAVECPDDGGGYRRVTVVVRVSGVGETLAPVWTSTTVIDPAAAANNDGTPQTLCQKPDGSGLELCSEEVDGTSMDLYLTNTPAGGHDARVEPAASGPLHKTVAIPPSCHAGAAVGCPVPDLMVGEPLAQLAEEDPVPPLRTFAADVEPSVAAGRPLLEDVACDATPTRHGGDDVNLRGAYWVSPVLDAPIHLRGVGGLYLYARTWSETAADVTLCGIVYRAPASVANPVLSPPHEIGRIDVTTPWPETFQPVAATFDFDLDPGDPHATVEADERIGLRLWVADGSADEIVLLYDHPLNQSRLTLVVEETG